MSVVIGIDVGGSTTKIGGFRSESGGSRLIEPLFVQANDPITSAYGAFGKFIEENNLSLGDVDKVLMTGVGASFIKRGIYGLPCETVPEFGSIGLGGLYLSGLRQAIIVSLGTGTAIVHARAGKPVEYLGGTGVGGGTLLGLSRLLLNAETVENIDAMAAEGDLSRIDLRIGDMTSTGTHGKMPMDMTAANFGNVSDLASREDIARGILNLVYETVGVSAIFAARAAGVGDVVLTGNLANLPFCRKKFADFERMYEGVRFLIPERAPFATVIGTALCGTNQSDL